MLGNDRVIILLIAVACCIACNKLFTPYSTLNKSYGKMQMSEPLKMSINDNHTVILQSRGSAGLKLSFRSSNSDIVEIKRSENEIKADGGIIGGSMPVIFEIKALKKGSTTVDFYESRPWDKNFQEIIQKTFVISVL